jgi:hypothetical protein
MGARGPVPNRSGDLSRDRDVNRSDRAPLSKGKSRPATIPAADPTWHPIALMLWNAAIESGQTDFYESSDYALLYSLCEDLSTYKKPSIDKDGNEYVKRNGQILATIYSALGDLLISEGQRRRLRLELEDEVEEDAEVIDINERKRRIGMAV